MNEAPNGAATGWRAHLVDDWRECKRWWSMRLAWIGAVLPGLVLLFPDALNALPQDMRDKLPEGYTVALVVVISIARLWKQKPKAAGDGNQA